MKLAGSSKLLICCSKCTDYLTKSGLLWVEDRQRACQIFFFSFVKVSCKNCNCISRNIWQNNFFDNTLLSSIELKWIVRIGSGMFLWGIRFPTSFILPCSCISWLSVPHAKRKLIWLKYKKNSVNTRHQTYTCYISIVYVIRGRACTAVVRLEKLKGWQAAHLYWCETVLLTFFQQWNSRL